MRHTETKNKENFAKFFVKRAAPLLLRWNLLVFREELFILLLSIK